MTRPDIQYFASSGTWTKPAGAVRVDIVLQGGGAGSRMQYTETVSAGGTAGSGGAGAGGSIASARIVDSGTPGECGGNSSAYIGRLINPNGYQAFSGEPGGIRVSSFDAADVADTVEIEVGKGGRPGGRDGYALIVTHLAEESATAPDRAAELQARLDGFVGPGPVAADWRPLAEMPEIAAALAEAETETEKRADQ